MLDVLRLFEVLQVLQVGDELGLLEHLLLSGQVMEIRGIGKTLYKLGAC